MIDTNQLRGAIVAAGFTSIGEAGRAIGIKPSTMYLKMKSSSFTMAEIDDMIEVFRIRHPEEIFILGRSK